jgi:hypothetical protein
MFNLDIDGVTYTVTITKNDNDTYTCIAKTIVEEGKTPVNTYKLNLTKRNPMTLQLWDSTKIMNFLTGPNGKSEFWMEYFDEPTEEEDEEE